jgi:imidazolonepropionase-like amidohydrolase
MKAFIISMLLVTGCILNTFSQEKEFYLKAGMLYDSKQNSLSKGRVIHVKGNRILDIGNSESIPMVAEVIDLSDYTVLPGLIDAHTHVLFSQEPQEDFAEESIAALVLENQALRTLRGAKRAKSYLNVGITSIKDLGNSGLFLDVALRDAIHEGTIDGPRIFASGPIMGASGGQLYGVSHEHQDLVGLEYRIIKGVADAKNAVREHVNQKVDVIKICADNLPNNTRLTVEEMKAIVEIAHSYDLTVTAHSVTNLSAWEAATAGVDGIEHGFNLADSILALMAQKNIYLVPTENSRDYMHSYYELAGSNPEELTWLDRYFENTKNRLSRAIKNGVPIVAGSDNYTDIKIPRGTSSRDMFRAYYEAGMKPLDILQAATYVSAKHFNKENEIGILQPGSFADIIAVKGDLKNDFLNTLQNLIFVMKNGNIYMNKSN